MSTEPLDCLKNSLAGRYVLEKELGRGGMATVYLARDLKHDRPVALKVMHPELAATLGPERFLREIRTTARLQHAHILPVLDSGEAGGLLWYTMPYVRGESLRERLRREVQLPVDHALEVARQVALALDHAHREGVVHRDLKPENILLSEGQALVADFGVAKALGSGDAQLTETGLALGTPAYMSPEQASGGAVDARSDVYALGCVLYEMLAGEPPFTGPTPQAITIKRLTDPVPSVRRVRDVVPEHVEEALTRALAKVPADRFATVAEFARALHEASTLADLPSRSTSRASELTPVARRSRRLLIAGIATLILLTLAGAATILWQSRPRAGALDANRLAVAPFDVLDPGLQLWREGLVDLVARNLDGAGSLRTVPPTAVMRRWTGHADPLSAAELGRRTGAGLTLFGSLVPGGGDSVRIRATLLDVGAGQTLAEFELHDAGNRVDRLGDSLAVRVLGELGRHRRLELTRVASLGSTSPAALKAFLQGEQWFRRAAWDSSLANYERAVALDSGFALALWRLGRVVGWQRIGFDSLSRVLSLRAGALNHGLAPRDSLLVAVDSMMSAGVRESWAGFRRRVETAREATRHYPDDADAWHTLGEVYVHSFRPVLLRQALVAFDRAIVLDSAYAPAYIHAIELASGFHGLEIARRYAAEYLRRAPDDVTAEGIRLAFDLADPALADGPEVRGRLERASANVLLKAWLPVANAVDSGEVAVRIGRVLAAAPESSAVWLPVAFRRAANVLTLAYRGHFQEAAREWQPDLFFSPAILASLALVRAYPADSTDAHFRRWLRAGDLPAAFHGLSWWAARGDAQAIAQFRQLADSVATSSADSALRQDGLFGAEAARAYLTLVRKDSALALRQFESLPDSFCTLCPQESLVRLQLWAARGEDRRVLEEAEAWMFDWGATEVSRQLEGARAAERLGAREQAIHGYQFVTDAWRHADPELQPYVAEARRALQRLTGEPRP